MTLCFQFSEDYPRTPILLELKSHVMSFKLLDGLTKVCEQEAKKLIGQMQVCTQSKWPGASISYLNVMGMSGF